MGTRIIHASIQTDARRGPLVTESAGEPQDSHSDRNSTLLEEDDVPADDLEDLDVPQELDRQAEARPREGLPPGFRMRHDAHYVEELTGRAATTARTGPRPSAPPPEPSLMPRAAWDLASSLDLALGQAALCARRSAGYAIDVLQADLGRAARVARATAIMLGTPELQRRELDAAALVGKAARATALARRLAGVALEVSIDDRDFKVPVDAALVTQALAGAMDVMLAMLERAQRQLEDDAAEVPIGAIEPLAFAVRCVRTRPAMIIELVQRSVSVDPASIGRFFDAACDLHPGGASAALLLAAAARIIRAHGGRVDVRRDEPVGCTMTFILPQIPTRGAEL
jgi:hypothetical protein